MSKYGDFLWSIFSHIRTEYGDLLVKFPFSLRMRKNRDQKKAPYLDNFHAVNNSGKDPEGHSINSSSNSILNSILYIFVDLSA